MFKQRYAEWFIENGVRDEEHMQKFFGNLDHGIFRNKYVGLSVFKEAGGQGLWEVGFLYFADLYRTKYELVRVEQYGGSVARYQTEEQVDALFKVMIGENTGKFLKHTQGEN